MWCDCAPADRRGDDLRQQPLNFKVNIEAIAINFDTWLGRIALYDYYSKTQRETLVRIVFGVFLFFYSAWLTGVKLSAFMFMPY